MFYKITEANLLKSDSKDFLEKHYKNIKELKNETVTSFKASPGKYVIENNKLVLNPDFEAEQLKEAKTSKLAEINTAKEKAFKEGIIFNGAHFDCDDRAQDRTGNRLLLLQAMPVETLEWLDFNYKPVEMNASDFQALCAAIFERVQFIEFKTGQLLEAVSEASSIDEIETVDINFSE